jgi:hypothetical protein
MSDSPAIAPHAAWTGVEVEGRLTGTPTLFVGRLDGVAHCRAIEALVESHAIGHVYLNPQSFEHIGWGLARALVRSVPIVTLALDRALYNALPDDLFKACHIVLIVPVDRRPKPTDEIRLDLGPYHVMTGPAWAFLETEPERYADDRAVIERPGGSP